MNWRRVGRRLILVMLNALKKCRVPLNRSLFWRLSSVWILRRPCGRLMVARRRLMRCLRSRLVQRLVTLLVRLLLTQIPGVPLVLVLVRRNVRRLVVPAIRKRSPGVITVRRLLGRPLSNCLILTKYWCRRRRRVTLASLRKFSNNRKFLKRSLLKFLMFCSMVRRRCGRVMVRRRRLMRGLVVPLVLIV